MPRKVVTEDDINQLLADLHTKHPDFKLITKDTTSERCTTIGTTISVPRTWNQLPPAQRYIRLHHEAVHLGQFQRYGTLGFLLRYTLWPVPVGSAYTRYTWEREAFLAEMQAIVEVYGPEALHAKREYYLQQFTGKPYYWAWMWPGSAARWVDRMIALLTPPSEKR